MNGKALLMLFVSILLLVGCGGQKSTGITPKATDDVIQTIPKWYMNPDQDPNYIIATGTATSRDLSLARDKAATEARSNIAKTVETKFNGLSKRFQEEVGTGAESQYLDMFTQATKEVTSTILSGAVIDKTEVMNESGVFRVYVLVKMPIGATSQALLNKLKQQEEMYTRFRSSQVFEELEGETEKFENWKKGN